MREGDSHGRGDVWVAGGQGQVPGQGAVYSHWYLGKGGLTRLEDRGCSLGWGSSRSPEQLSAIFSLLSQTYRFILALVVDCFLFRMFNYLFFIFKCFHF